MRSASEDVSVEADRRPLLDDVVKTVTENTSDCVSELPVQTPSIVTVDYMTIRQGG
jgi:hypothetical protein